MSVMFYIFCIVAVICITIIILNRMDNKNAIEKEKLELLKKNPELFKKVFDVK